VYWAIIKPEFNPAALKSFTSIGGKPAFNLPSVRRNIRLSEMAASSEVAMLRKSAAMPTGSPWKFPPESAMPGLNRSGLSVAALISRLITS
jgi:hypothetical protein